jgi:hypothetical protein
MPHVLSDDIGGDFLKITYTNGIKEINIPIKIYENISDGVF